MACSGGQQQQMQTADSLMGSVFVGVRVWMGGDRGGKRIRRRSGP